MFTAKKVLTRSSHIATGAFVLSTGIALVQPCQAEEGMQAFFFGGVGLGYRALEFDQKISQIKTGNLNKETVDPGDPWGFPSNNGTTEYDVDFYILSLSGGVGLGDFYLVFEYETNIVTEEENYDSVLVSQGAGSFGDPVTTSSFYNSDFDRVDSSLTFGWNVMENVALFTGFKYGETENDYKGEKATGVTTSVLSPVSSSFEEDGFFVGASYSLKLEPGNLTFSIAWADMDGDFTQKGAVLVNKQSDNTLGGGDRQYSINQDSFKYDGDTDGFSFGVSWNGDIDERLGYSIGLKQQSYEFDSKATVLQTAFWEQNGQDFESRLLTNAKIENEETVLTFSGGIRYIF